MKYLFWGKPFLGVQIIHDRPSHSYYSRRALCYLFLWAVFIAFQVSSDGQKVRRSTPLGEPLDVDERTVYVEDLPPRTTIDTMQRDFGKCGSVEYIK